MEGTSVLSYKHPETLVDAEWLMANLSRPACALSKSTSMSIRTKGHIPGAIGWDWSRQLCDQLRRDILSKEAFEHLMSESGSSRHDDHPLRRQQQLVSRLGRFGSSRSWPADVRLLNGGRRKWLELDLPLSTDVPQPEKTAYPASPPDLTQRAF